MNQLAQHFADTDNPLLIAVFAYEAYLWRLEAEKSAARQLSSAAEAGEAMRRIHAWRAECSVDAIDEYIANHTEFRAASSQLTMKRQAMEINLLSALQVLSTAFLEQNQPDIEAALMML